MRTRFRVVDLGPPQLAADINNRGQLVGQQLADAQQGTRAVLLDGRKVSELGSLGGGFSAAKGINDKGVVVGGSLTADDEAHHGFIHCGGKMHDLNALLSDGGWEVLHALAINDRDQIVAIASSGGQDRAVLLVPV